MNDHLKEYWQWQEKSSCNEKINDYMDHNNVVMYHRDMTNATCDLVLHLQSEGLNIIWISLSTIPSQYLKTIFAISYSTVIGWEPAYFLKVWWNDMRSWR